MLVPPGQTSAHILSQYLIEAYSPREFLRLLRRYPELQEVCFALEEDSAPVEFFANAVLALVRRSLLTSRFFRQLQESRPGRRADVEALERAVLDGDDAPPPSALCERYGADAEIELTLRVPFERLTAAQLEQVLRSFRALTGNPDVVTVHIRAGSTVLRIWCRHADYQRLLRALDRGDRPLVFEVEAVSFRRDLSGDHDLTVDHVARDETRREPGRSPEADPQTPADPLRAPPSPASVRQRHAEGSDSDLHARFVSGDKAAGGELCRRHFDAICAYFERRLPSLAEDLAQEVFVVYARAPEKMKGASVRAFLFGVARNVLLHALRRQARHPEAELPEMSIRDAATGVSTIVAEHEATRLFLEALQSLSMVHQDLVELLFFEGLTVAEAAVALDIPENTCRSRRRRAIVELRKRVEELELDPRRVAVALTKLGQLRRQREDGAEGGLGIIRELFADVSAADLRQMIAGSPGSTR